MSPEKGTENVMDTQHPLHPQSLEDKYSMILKPAHCEWARTKTTGNISASTAVAAGQKHGSPGSFVWRWERHWMLALNTPHSRGKGWKEAGILGWNLGLFSCFSPYCCASRGSVAIVVFSKESGPAMQ